MKILPIILGFFAITASAFATIKTLTDVQGRSIEVRIIHVDDDSAFVEMRDGREFDIPLKNLMWADQDYLASWTPTLNTPENPIDCVVIINAGEGTGSGFLAYDKGRTYLYTNQHVIMDGLDVSAKDSRGQNIELGALEVSNGQDMARYRVDVEQALEITDTVSPDDVLKVLGNSQGMGVITSADAKVQGVGPFEIEVDADFVPGNSGGPAVDAKGRVVGMATYIRAAVEEGDWVTEDTRYAKARRFTVRPSRVNDWIKMKPSDYSRQYKEHASILSRVEQVTAAYQLLTSRNKYLRNIPDHWEREITDILKNHNRRVFRPDSTTTYVSDGYYMNRQVRSHRDNKNSSRRTNLRALQRYAESLQSSFYRLENATFQVDYFKTNKVKGTRVLDARLQQVIERIRGETGD